jgi:hypothetical protein
MLALKLDPALVAGEMKPSASYGQLQATLVLLGTIDASRNRQARTGLRRPAQELDSTPTTRRFPQCGAGTGGMEQNRRLKGYIVCCRLAARRLCV